MVEAKKPPNMNTTVAMSNSGGRARTPDEELASTTTAPASERWESESDLSQTLRMSSAPSRPTVPRPAGASAPQPASGPVSVKGIELLVIDERQAPGAERRPWRAAEVWTKRRIYGLDSTFRCVEVLERETGRPEITHEMVGARLGGGRMRDRDAVRFSYPLPLPGMEAMFMKGKKHGYTSAVERMVVRIRVLHTSAGEVPPSWDDIASRWSDVPPKP